MKIRSIAFAATLTAVAAWPTLLSAESPSHDRQTITPAFKEMVPNIPGKSLVGLVVTHPPGGATPAHSHPRSAFVISYVLTGSIRSQVDHGKTQVFHAGEHWTEPTGAYHPISGTPPMPTGWSHMNTNETAARPAASVQQPVSEGCMRSLEFGRIPLPAGGQNGARLPANVWIWPHTDESQRVHSVAVGGTPEIANVCRHRAKQIGVGRGLCQEACHG